ncbi:MAG: HIT domain-containing protein [candidate division WOR-3 bacterium]
MECIWAPWRMEYIEKASKDDDCFICTAIKEGPSVKNLLLGVFKNAVIIMNRFPYNPGHLMVAPIKHTGIIGDLSDSEMLELFRLVDYSIKLLKKVMSPHGFNVGINIGKCAGAGLETHVHIHVVPRWNGDTNFMPVIADVKVIPEHIERTYEKIKEAMMEEPYESY